MKNHILILRYVLFAYTSLYALFGVMLITCGSVFMSYHTVSVISIQISSIGVIVSGLVILCLSAYGYFANWKQSPILLCFFAGGLVTLCIFKTFAVLVTAITTNEFAHLLKGVLYEKLLNYNDVDDDRLFWDNIHEHYQCCGIESAGDWTRKHINLPKSCCVSESTDSTSDESLCQLAGHEHHNLNTEGCHEKLVQEKKDIIKILTATVIAVVVIETIGVGIITYLAIDLKVRD